jgi:DNA-binding CsgD family transcriptional regulator
MKKPVDPMEVLFSKLDTIKDLLAYLVSVEHDTLKKKAVALSSMGLPPADIARIIGTSPKTVSVRLAEAKRKKKR